METKKIVIILVALAVAIIAVCLIITSIHNDDGPNGQYNYEVDYSKTFQTGAGLTITAEDGRTFAIAKMTVKNDSFSPGINTVELVWKLTLDKMTYSQSVLSESHKDFWAVTINEGKTWKYTVVFEIDENAVGKKDLSIGYSYPVNSGLRLNYNKDLKADGTVGSSIEMFASVQKMYVPAY